MTAVVQDPQTGDTSGFREGVRQVTDSVRSDITALFDLDTWFELVHWPSVILKAGQIVFIIFMHFFFDLWKVQSTLTQLTHH